MSSAAAIFDQLMQVIEDRRQNPPLKSYTSQLFSHGNPRITAKIAEESRELIEASTDLAENAADAAARSHLVHEAADLVYHLLVLLGYHRIPLSDLADELQRRCGTSGIDEKASRHEPQSDD